MDLVASEALLQEILTVLPAMGSILETAEVVLFRNDIEPTPTLVKADYTVANYTGYADEAVTWSAITLSDDAVYELIGTVGEFRPTGTAATNTIYGFTLEDGAGLVVAAARFDEPQQMASPLNAIQVTIRLRVSAGGLVVQAT